MRVQVGAPPRSRTRLGLGRGTWVSGAAALSLALAPAFLGDAGAEPPAPPTGLAEARIELGRRLFFDPVVSRTGFRACVACHDPDHAFSDPQRLSDDDFGPSRRHAQTLIDLAANPSAHWDGEFESLEELVMARVARVSGTTNKYDPRPFASPTVRPPPPPQFRDGAGRADPPPSPPEPPRFEPSAERRDTFGDHPLDLNLLPDVAQTLEDAGRYAEGFDAAFGSRSVTTARIARAIAEFCRSIRSTEAPFDRWLAGDASALQPGALRGLELFRGRAGCAQCHPLAGAHPAFTDYAFRNNGVTWQSLRRTLGGGREHFDVENVVHADLGRGEISTASGDVRRFKVPTLRDVARSAPYMHDGSLATLADVVRHYARGGAPDPRQDERIRPFSATDTDVAHLVAFLQALSGDERAGLAGRTWDRRVSRTRARFVDGRGRPLAGLAVTLVPEGDAVPGAAADASRRPLETDEHGRLEFSPSSRTHVRLALPGDVIPVGGALVPDTCARLEVRVPVDGRVRVALTLDANHEPPPRFHVQHAAPFRLPGDPFPTTVFERVGQTDVGAQRIVLYEGWRRTDVPTKVTFRLPHDGAGMRRELDLASRDTIRVEE